MPLPTVLPAESTLKALLESVGSCVRVRVNERGVCSGLLLTPKLVLVPEYGLSGVGTALGASAAVRVSTGRGGVAIDAVVRPERVDGMPLYVLALGRDAAPASALRLGLNPPEVGSFIALLGYPDGGSTVHISFGDVVPPTTYQLCYRLASRPGSGGGALLNGCGEITGIHLISQPAEELRAGLSIAAMLPALRRHTYWSELASFHKILDVARVIEAIKTDVVGTGPSPRPDSEVPIRDPDRALYPAVARHALTLADRAKLSPRARKALEPLVVDPKSERWVLKSESRRRLAGSASSAKMLLGFVRTGKARAVTAADRAIASVLKGPPFDLGKPALDELSWWVQAVRWFDGVPGLAGLPTPTEVARVLERRRAREKLTQIAGPDFVGRTGELKKLHEWFEAADPPAMVVSGIGGMGKSSLVANFAAGLVGPTPMIWLDFDRADLAPDDALSVLKAISRQLGAAHDNFTEAAPTTDPNDWRPAAEHIGMALAGRGGEQRPLIVLDSFEVAQYHKRHQELWPLIEVLVKHAPRSKVLVVSRASNEGRPLGSLPTGELHLNGLSSRDSKRWLLSHGIKSGTAVNAVVKLSHGSPLALRLMKRLKDTCGKFPRVPAQIKGELVAGFLYERVLDRVLNPTLKCVAMGALALRRLTPDMVAPVLGQVPEFPAEPVATWFDELAREASLFERSTGDAAGGSVAALSLRHEVRTAALWLLEHDQAKIVRSIEEAAVAWYAAQPSVNSDPTLAAELVYHKLRLGDTDGARSAWIEGCGSRLRFASDNLTGAAKKWLSARLGESEIAEDVEQVWEAEASERIVSSRKRSLARAAGSILQESSSRGVDSELVFHEAYERWLEDDYRSALEVLDRAGPGGRDVAGPRAALKAAVFVAMGHPWEADRALKGVETSSYWERRRGGAHERLAVSAARFRIACELEVELEAARHAIPPPVNQMFGAWEFILPALQGRVASEDTNPDAMPPRIMLGDERSVAPEVLDLVRKDRQWPYPRAWNVWDDETPIDALVSEMESWLRVNRGKVASGDAPRGTLARSIVLGWRRWSILLGRDSAFRAPLEADSIGWGFERRQMLSAIGAVAPLLVLSTPRVGWSGLGPGPNVLASSADPDFLLTKPPPARKARLERLLGKKWKQDLELLKETGRMKAIISERAALALHLLSPHPLEELLAALSGDSRALRGKLP